MTWAYRSNTELPARYDMPVLNYIKWIRFKGSAKVKMLNLERKKGITKTGFLRWK